MKTKMKKNMVGLKKNNLKAFDPNVEEEEEDVDLLSLSIDQV